ncbi:MAG: hypothetical protein HUK09_02755 [Bacteroidaceae bacterium]|nr:hypothetical protein [Bacteroidaceae bacterium]
MWKLDVAEGRVNWPKGEVAIADFFKYLKGEDGANGKNGANGVDGKSAYELWKGSIATGQVPNPHKPSEMWPADNNSMAAFWYFLSGGTGEMGKTPYVGDNGNWFIDGQDTGLPSRGEKGDRAEAPTISISDRNTWVINGFDTGANARGIDGKNGKDGKNVTIELDPNGNFFFNGIDSHIPWRGQAGKDGAPGKNVNITISANNTWVVDGVDTNQPTRGNNGAEARVGISDSGTWVINGVDTGKPARGADGKHFTISIVNGTWWVNGVDTHQPAQGPQGDDGTQGHTPSVEISADGFWVIDGVKTTQTALAQDGQTVEVSIANGFWVINGVQTTMPALGVNGRSPEMYVGANKNWWVRLGSTNTDTGYPSIGNDGTNRPAPVITIGANGNWLIDGNDTGVTAKGLTGAAGAAGATGAPGADGKSVYELWKEQVATGTLVNPHEPTEYWPTGSITINDYWQYLRGADGKDGKAGQDGVDGQPGISVEVGKANVLPIYYNGQMRDYVDPATGAVTMEVYDATGAKVGAGATVKGLPGMDPNKTYTTDAEGRFKIMPEDLPTLTDGTVSAGAPAQVTINGAVVEASDKTIVPNRVYVRLKVGEIFLMQETLNPTLSPDRPNNWTRIKYVYERQVNGTWSEYPSTYPQPVVSPVKVNDPTQPVTAANVTNAPEWGRPNDGPRYDLYRPIVFTADMDVPSANVQSLVRKLHSVYSTVKWNNQDNYFSLRGTNYFYGFQPLLDTPVHNPEIYPSIPAKDMKYAIQMGSNVLWGTFDLTKTNPYYDTVAPSTLSGQAVWKGTRKLGTTLFPTYDVVVKGGITTTVAGTTGSQVATKTILSSSPAGTTKDFLLPSSRENNIFYVYGNGPQRFVEGLSYPLMFYYLTPQFVLAQEGSNYVMRNPYKLTNEDTPLTIQDFPAGWGN